MRLASTDQLCPELHTHHTPHPSCLSVICLPLCTYRPPIAVAVTMAKQQGTSHKIARILNSQCTNEVIAANDQPIYISTPPLQDKHCIHSTDVYYDVFYREGCDCSPTCRHTCASELCSGRYWCTRAPLCCGITR
jgi:hypothetical protein